MNGRIAGRRRRRGCAPEPGQSKTHLRIANNVEQRDDVRTASKVLQDFDFTLNFLLLDRLQDLDDAFLVVDDIDALEHLGVLAPA